MQHGCNKVQRREEKEKEKRERKRHAGRSESLSTCKRSTIVEIPTLMSFAAADAQGKLLILKEFIYKLTLLKHK